ncbi:hypothetical protein GGR21_004202 [Dysgonomonas hofstadii]|uniref:Uncharacterized protein n=1 Tax=Dysgonomonas hofstadii TaxID=637886 RepID=A0A840CQI5_9BACT|nr:hypothetical protein [Dysgonomonas hofstadii]
MKPICGYNILPLQGEETGLHFSPEVLPSGYVMQPFQGVNIELHTDTKRLKALNITARRQRLGK